MCVCTNPGRSVNSLASIVRSIWPLGRCCSSIFPIAAMRSSRTSRSPCRMSRRAFIVTMVAFLKRVEVIAKVFPLSLRPQLKSCATTGVNTKSPHQGTFFYQPDPDLFGIRRDYALLMCNILLRPQRRVVKFRSEPPSTRSPITTAAQRHCQPTSSLKISGSAVSTIPA